MDTLSKVQTIFQELFDDDELVVSSETTASDIEEWDSVMHVSLILEIEAAFEIRLSSGEVAGLQSVGELCALIEGRRGAP